MRRDVINLNVQSFSGSLGQIQSRMNLIQFVVSPLLEETVPIIHRLASNEPEGHAKGNKMIVVHFSVSFYLGEVSSWERISRVDLQEVNLFMNFLSKSETLNNLIT